MKDVGSAANLVVDALREARRSPHDCGGPLDGWCLSPEDVVLFLARHRALQNGAAGDQRGPLSTFDQARGRLVRK